MPGKFYVYELIDPRSGKPFYVGKGSGRRVDQHERDARAGAELGRFDRIKEIWAAGLGVEKRILACFDDESAAYEAESERIAEIGPENLTNRTAGAGFDSDASQDKKWTRALYVIRHKTSGFIVSKRLFYGQKWHQIPACALIVFRNQWEALVAKRGEAWMLGHCTAMRNNAV